MSASHVNSNPKLVRLASASPRRAELLRQIGIGFEQSAVNVPEVPRPDEAPEVFVLRLALAKARAGVEQGGGLPVLGADTVVVVDEQILGKPRDREDGLAMLARLAGREHQVYTGVALVDSEQELTRLSVSNVEFDQLNAAQLAAYWASGEPADKAGAYAIQGLGACFVRRLEGSYSGVMGLPLYETAELLRAFGIKPLGNGNQLWK